MIILTIREIKDLAEGVGLTINHRFDPDDLDSDIAITLDAAECKNDDGKIQRFAHVAHFVDYPEEGVIPLGDPLPSVDGSEK